MIHDVTSLHRPAGDGVSAWVKLRIAARTVEAILAVIGLVTLLTLLGLVQVDGARADDTPPAKKPVTSSTATVRPAPARPAGLTAAAARELVQPPAKLGPNRALGKKLAAARGWTGTEFTCLSTLWAKESGWDHTALNENTGDVPDRLNAGMVGKYGDAYGIPQSLPPSKMASAGRDWRTNPETQIRWGLSYIAGRYGSPCRAWSHWWDPPKTAPGRHWY